jgi:hypothetical protein
VILFYFELVLSIIVQTNDVNAGISSIREFYVFGSAKWHAVMSLANGSTCPSVIKSDAHPGLKVHRFIVYRF